MEASMEQIEVYPSEDGSWGWRRTGGESEDGEDGFDARGAAIAAGREAAGGETLTLTNGAGEERGTVATGTSCRVVLMREDGSEYGELDPPPSTPDAQANAHRVTLTPATENSEAGLDS